MVGAGGGGGGLGFHWWRRGPVVYNWENTCSWERGITGGEEMKRATMPQHQHCRPLITKITCLSCSIDRRFCY